MTKMASVRKPLPRLFAWSLRWISSAEEIPALEQTAWQRARVDASSFAAGKPIRFGILTTAGAGGVGALAAVLASGVPLLLQIALGALGTVAGFLVAVLVIAAICWVLAFPKQRNEARTEGWRLHPTAADGPALVKEFSAWVLTRRESMPKAGGFRLGWGVFPQPGMSNETHYGLMRDREKRADDFAAVEAETRSQYHERFRDRVVSILGDVPSVREPQTIDDLEKLSVRLARATGTAPSPKVILRSLSREGHRLRREMSHNLSIEQRKVFEPRVDGFRARASEEFLDCAPEALRELEDIPAYHPADWDGVPMVGKPSQVDGYLDELLKVIDGAVKTA
jgi:hypothetical protein